MSPSSDPFLPIAPLLSFPAFPVDESQVALPAPDPSPVSVGLAESATPVIAKLEATSEVRVEGLAEAHTDEDALVGTRSLAS